MSQLKKEEREMFTSKFGFIISCVGAALGLGNIWMFSYRLGTYGGAAFLIPYFIFIFLLGTTGLITEFSFGRMFKAGSLTGLGQLFKERKIKGGRILAVIPVLGVTGILMFYSIVVGWVLKYFVLSINGQLLTMEPSSYFENFAGTASSIPWFLLATLLTMIIVRLGVIKGIEKLNKVAMPLLLLLFVILMIRSVTLPGAEAGIQYLLKPRWEYLLKVDTWVMALGQAFFSVSLTGCTMVTYGSYTDEKYDIITASVATAVFDTIAALLAAFMIMPAVFAFGFDPQAGPALLFITIPSIFKLMPYGNLLSALFFLSIIFAAISSTIALLEGPVEALMSKTKLTRRQASNLISVIAFVLALPLAVNLEWFNSFSDFITIILSPIGAMITAVSIFYLYKGDILSEINKGAKRPLGELFIKFAKYVFVPVTIIIILLGITYGGIG